MNNMNMNDLVQSGSLSIYTLHEALDEVENLQEVHQVLADTLRELENLTEIVIIPPSLQQDEFRNGIYRAAFENANVSRVSWWWEDMREVDPFFIEMVCSAGQKIKTMSMMSITMAEEESSGCFPRV